MRPGAGAPPPGLPEGRRRRNFWTYLRKFTRNVRLILLSYPVAGVSQAG